MFGCVIDTLGYRDNFTQVNEGTFVLQIPNLACVNYISVFVFQPETLGTVAAQVIVEQSGLQEPVGFLADFQPSLTFVTPKFEGRVDTSVPAQVMICAMPIEDVVRRQQHCLDQTENNMVDFNYEKLAQHFREAMERYVRTDGGEAYLPLSQI